MVDEGGVSEEVGRKGAPAPGAVVVRVTVEVMGAAEVEGVMVMTTVTRIVEGSPGRRERMEVEVVVIVVGEGAGSWEWTPGGG